MVLLVVMIKSDVSFFYNIDDNSKTDYDCFYAYIIDDSFVQKDGTVLRTDYLTPYCLRPSSNDSSIFIEENVANATTFKSLRSQQISSKQLYEWSISIDIIEQYIMYLSTNDTKFDEIIFYNCSSSWFGSHCQYTFGSNTLIKSFGDFLVSSFKNRKEYLGKITINTCYPYLSECDRGPEQMCLDWREICDGKIDCIGNSYGLDEQYCEELEINECKKDEYRCRNGAQCIPLDFYEDGVTSKDCLDGTDENEKFIGAEILCIDIVTFTCEEKTCTHQKSFVCGDGQCIYRSLISVQMLPMVNGCKGTGRHLYYHQAVYSTAKYLPSDCYKFLFCTLNFYYILQNDIYDEKMCLSNNWLLSNNCSIELLSFPPKPLLYNYFQLIYSSERLVDNSTGIILPNYICNDPRSCLHLSNTTFQIGDLVCRPTEQFIKPNDYNKDMRFINTLLIHLFEFCSLTGNTNENYRSKSSLFYCQLSDKYISKHRLIDRIDDCHYGEDESYFDKCLSNHSQPFSCASKKKCLSALGIGDRSFPNCVDAEDNLISNSQESVFRRLCNVINNYITSSDIGENDESNCEWWPCNNPYTRCDDVFQCGNGIDEIGCPNYNCSVNELKCYIGNSNAYRCIPHAYIYEKPINCSLSHVYKPICRRIFYSSNFTNNTNEYLSWKENSCIKEHNITGCKSNNDQQLICTGLGNILFYHCDALVFDMDNNEHLCKLTSPNLYLNSRTDRVFSTLNLGYLPSIINTTSLSSHEHINDKTMKIEDMNNSIELIEYCNRGIVIFEGKSYNKKCLCSPSYFGNQCQWQNQRISLTLRIRKLSSFTNKIFIYEIFIYLIDDKYQRIDSYEKIQYIPSIDCETKFNRYLIYSTRPKHLNSNYSIHIDIYDKMTLNYYGSWYLFLPFQFLPVNRLSTQLLIPSEKSESLKNCSLECGAHGKCFFYINSLKSFCKCDQNYSGRFCNLTYQCSCSPDSICLNSSICLCPLNKFGSKCYIQSESCQPNNPCKNNGQCIPIDDRIKKNGFICFCTEDYTGSTCEYKSNRIDLTFKTDIIPSIIYAHFITGFQNQKHERTTKFKKVPFDENSISLFTNQPFHILFIEFFNNYYLSVLRETYIQSEYISTDIKSDNICINITKLFNSSILNFPELRRLKYYQLPCIQNSKLKCFYDEKHMCICDKNRYSNCFEFNHNINYACQGHNYCENNGTCFQDSAACPTKSICMCDKCYYGSKCQFNTKGFSLSLDAIFGYYIKPSVSFLKQSKSVKITATITILMFIIGIISGSLSILTFKRENSVIVGCGIYLLTVSIISLLSITIFTIKYWQLVLFQMNSITNSSFISFSCLLTDMLLKVFLCSVDWLNACVAIERAFTAIQGVSFNKAKSRSMAKCIIPIVLFLIIVSYIHDPISRQLFPDEDEQRTWCTVNYSLKLKGYDTFINLFHFLTPFIINFVSALIIIIQVFKTRAKSQANVTRKSLLFAQIKRHKHLLISPCITILLVLPRLIISLMSRCMESPRYPWLLLTGYYISSVPPLLISVIFILPSEKYTDEFLTVIRRKRTTA